MAEEIKKVEETKEDNASQEIVDIDLDKEIEEEQDKKINDVIADIKIDEKSKKVIKAVDVRPGMYLKIYQRIMEKNSKGEDKTRLQMFEGLCIARKHGNEPGATFMVRKVVKGYVVEKIYPIYLPTLEKIELYKTFKVNKAKLYFVKRPNARKLKPVK